MITRHTRGKVVWVDMESPTLDELQSIMREFRIDARVEEEIISPTPYPIVVSFPSYIYMILHFPTTEASGGAKRQEIDFIVGKNFLITARYEVIETIHNLHKVFEAEELLDLPVHETHASELFERMMRRLYGAIRQESERIGIMLERIEKDIFAGHEREIVHTISEVNRVLLRFDTTLRRHAESLDLVFEHLSAASFFGKGFMVHASHIAAERDHVAALIASYREVAGELRITNDSLLSSSQNQVMKSLTIMSFVTFPLTFLAALFAMETDYLPIIGIHGDFWIILAIMLSLALSFLTFFKVKRWI